MSGVKKICVVTGSRAEFGQLLPLLRQLNDDPFCELKLIVTGAHLSGDYSLSLMEIEESGIEISERIPISHIEDNTPKGIALQISDVIASFAGYFSVNKPDLLIAIGDRYEMFAAGTAASTLLIPICHICGGSTTSGAIDEVYRHSLTKMSSIHFTTCDIYRKRVIQLGEDPSTVFNVGSLAIENCLNVELLDKDDLTSQLGMVATKPYCVVTFHPVTLERDTSQQELYELINAMDCFPQYQFLITLSNTDSGGEQINRIWQEEAKKRDHFFVVSSLGMKRYLSALKYADMMIGNSSSGTTEGPAMKIPVINIGDRQKGRIFSSCTIHCEPKKVDIVQAINEAGTKEFRQKAAKAKNPFGNGSTSREMIHILKTILAKPINIKKTFYDIDYEVQDEKHSNNTCT